MSSPEEAIEVLLRSCKQLPVVVRVLHKRERKLDPALEKKTKAVREDKEKIGKGKNQKEKLLSVFFPSASVAYCSTLSIEPHLDSEVTALRHSVLTEQLLPIDKRLPFVGIGTNSVS